MLLPSPSESRAAAWESPLALLPATGPERGEIEQSGLDSARDMPVIRIESPDAWLLHEVVEPAELPRAVREDSGHLYVMARFDCSFRPRGEKVRVEWARFRARLVSDPAGSAVAEDMHPWRVERTVRRNVGLKISPSIKFTEVEAAVGAYSRGADYEALEPVIEAAGRGGDDLSWDYSGARHEFISGGKRMHTIVKVPVDLTWLDAAIEISADLRVDRRLLWPASRTEDQAPMRIRLWSRECA
jgi:hypothetical protein